VHELEQTAIIANWVSCKVKSEVNSSKIKEGSD